MAIIDFVEWRPNGKNSFAWHFPQNNLSTATQLLVQESQEAVLFSKGQILGKFGPGRHTLSTENLPILRSLYGIPFGGKNPFTAEVWFVNKLQPSLDWFIDSFSIHDADYNTFIPLTANGRYTIKLNEAEKFLVKIVGTKEEYTEYDLLNQFEGNLTSKTKSAIALFMQNNRIGFKQIAAHLDNFSTYLRDTLSPFWANLGFALDEFYVNNIEIDDSTEEGAKIKAAIAQQSTMSITGHTWQQEQMFGTANNAIDGMGGNGNGGLLGGLMAMSMMSGMGSGGGAAMMQPTYNQPTFGGNGGMQPQMGGGMQPGGMQGGQPPKMVYCANCAKKFPNTVQFCPHCGHTYNPCPNCGTDNPDNARRCVSCGMTLQGAAPTCPHCHAPLAPGSTFCGNCGTPVVSASDVCTRCGAKFTSPNVKFCPQCGQKR